MRTLLLGAALVASAACSRSHPAPPAPAAIPTVTVDQVDQALARGAVQPVDDNGQPTRERMGVIPGAVLLSDEVDFKPSELPADKARPLVFYCANRYCGASRAAAQRARTAGHTHVEVMPAGIAGWVKAGKRVARI